MKHAEPVSQGLYELTTRSIRVAVEPYYLEEQSTPEENHYVWAYHVTIENNGHVAVQVLGRYWRVTDASGGVQEVSGDGVVGETPVLDPGDTYEYTSGTPLGTPSGIMVGRYRIKAETGEEFEIDIPAFSLDSPHQKGLIN